MKIKSVKAVSINYPKVPQKTKARGTDRYAGKIATGSPMSTSLALPKRKAESECVKSEVRHNVHLTMTQVNNEIKIIGKCITKLFLLFLFKITRFGNKESKKKGVLAN